MRRGYNFYTNYSKKILLLLTLLTTISGCMMQKKTAVNRVLQNITARYNLLFNANQLLQQKQLDYATAYIDTYDGLLNVYPDTIAHGPEPDKDIEAAIAKANTIINEKDQSSYIADAYMVIGKGNYLSGNYFNAVEFFNYVIRSFPKRADLVQEAYTWKARALLYLSNTDEAGVALDSALQKLAPKKRNSADVYATRLQYAINTLDFGEAEAMALKAVSATKQKSQKLRWTYILAQLQNVNQKKDAAIASYGRIVNSNAPFEMAFNASLNRISIEENRNGIKIDRTALLLKLLKSDNNVDFKDQIYYQVGELYRNSNNLPEAIRYYNLALRSSKGNQNQKGLAYLRIADLNFKNLTDYVTAKKYYDSVLISLPAQYPGYKQIKLKNNNLQLLVDNLKIISFEDTVQMLANLNEDARAKRIDELVDREILKERGITANAIAATAQLPAAGINTQSTNVKGGSGFYFYNAAAISKGINDFKQKWGNRQLADNWRLSQRSAADVAATIANTVAAGGDPDAAVVDIKKSDAPAVAGGYRQLLVSNIPLNPTRLKQSNKKVYNAYVEIGNFYRDILADKNEAMTSYLSALKRDTNNAGNAAIYYNLYRLNIDVNNQQAEYYKNKVMSDYPETLFAMVLLDPGYATRDNENEVVLNAAYNDLFKKYQNRLYDMMQVSADSLLTAFPDSRLLPQIKYLGAIAMGHRYRLEPFENTLRQIADDYPNDHLIRPLILQHLEYINAHRLELLPLPIVLDNNDTTGVIFSPPIAYQKETPYNRERVAPVVIQTRTEPVVSNVPAAALPKPSLPVNKPVVIETPKQTPVVNAPVVTAAKQPEAVNKPETVSQQPDIAKNPVVAPTVLKDTITKTITAVIKAPAKVVSDIFSLRDSTNYYFVLNVSTGTTDLSSSRFGIGQFNRATLKLNSLVHQLKFVGRDNQLISVGKFTSLAAVKDYSRQIIPLLPDIMKVSKDKYTFFIITQENLNKLADKKLLDSYIDYYQQIY